MDSTQMAHNHLFHHPAFPPDSSTLQHHHHHLQPHQLQLQFQHQHQHQHPRPQLARHHPGPHPDHVLSMDAVATGDIQIPPLIPILPSPAQTQHHQFVHPGPPDVFHPIHQQTSQPVHLLSHLESKPDVGSSHDHSRDVSNASSVATIATTSSQTTLDTAGHDGLDQPDLTGLPPQDEPEVMTVTYLDASRSFPTLDSAKAFVLERAKADGFGVSCRRSRKNRQGTIISAQMMCDRGRSATSTSTGQRRTRTRRTNCSWAVTIALQTSSGLWRFRDSSSKGPDGDDTTSPTAYPCNGALMISGPSLIPLEGCSQMPHASTSTTLRLVHNHPASKTPGSHPCHRKMTGEMETFIEALQSVQTRPSKIYQILQDRFPLVPVNQQDVYNALARLKKRSSSSGATSTITPVSATMTDGFGPPGLGLSAGLAGDGGDGASDPDHDVLSIQSFDDLSMSLSHHQARESTPTQTSAPTALQSMGMIPHPDLTSGLLS